MAGILDALNNMTPDQQQGLLAAAAQMMQQSGPSLRPTSLGQILGGGMTAYQDSANASRKRKIEEDAAKQSGLLRGLQIQEAQGGLADHDLARKQANDLRNFYLKDRIEAAPGAPLPTTPAAPPPMASAMPGGQGSPKIGGPDWMQSFQASQPAQAPMPASAPQAQASDADPYARRMALAQRLRAQGFHKEAAAEEDAARKDRPKFANEPRVVMGPGGKPMLVQMADDGTVRPIEGGYGVAEKLNFQGAGGNTLGLDPYTSEVKSTIKHTQSPDSIASNAIAIRGQNMTDARARELNAATAGNKPLTEFQGKATNFASRMTESDALVKKFEKAGINGSDFATIAAGSPLTNWAASEEGQMYRQAQENFVSANLRQESGAAIPKDEMNKEIRKYFPVVGDQPGVIAQKARARAIATKGMMVQAGPGAKSIGGIIAEDAAPSVAGAGAFSDASKEARYQEWKRSQNK